MRTSLYIFTCVVHWSAWSFIIQFLHRKWSMAVLGQPHVIFHVEIACNHLLPVDVCVIHHMQPPITMTQR